MVQIADVGRCLDNPGTGTSYRGTGQTSPGSQTPGSGARRQRHRDGRSNGLSRRQRSSPPTTAQGITPPPIITAGCGARGPGRGRIGRRLGQGHLPQRLARLVGLFAVQQYRGVIGQGRLLGDQMHHHRVRLRSRRGAVVVSAPGRRVGQIGARSLPTHRRGADPPCADRRRTPCAPSHRAARPRWPRHDRTTPPPPSTCRCRRVRSHRRDGHGRGAASAATRSGRGGPPQSSMDCSTLVLRQHTPPG